VLQTLADNVDGRPATQATVPAGDGSDAAVAVISMDKYLPGQRLGELVGRVGSGAGSDLTVAP
jgi:serine/threonine-protein kinase RsbW